MTPWVTASSEAETVSPVALQFGHGGDAVGDAPSISRPPSAATRLQFGHGGDAVGDFLARQLRVAEPSLQFGHGGDAVGDLFLVEPA